MTQNVCNQITWCFSLFVVFSTVRRLIRRSCHVEFTSVLNPRNRHGSAARHRAHDYIRKDNRNYDRRPILHVLRLKRRIRRLRHTARS